MSKSKVASIRALQELKEIVEERRRLRFDNNLLTARREVDTAKKVIRDKVEKAIAELAVAKFEDLGLTLVPVCHRRSSQYDGRAVVELKITIYPGVTEDKVKAVESQIDKAVKDTEDWYFKAVQAVASQVDLPETPDFG